ncbi:type I-E CRISPR-associated protein Cse2/CasB [Streptomyces luteireticuli]|uniref:Type I-E CRISPR-associated protein Cse2/CasB n=1 Tax=Streptomyces luteireticuli TaxID=173858 RepID=A0ABN0YW83_9ACTN
MLDTPVPIRTKGSASAPRYWAQRFRDNGPWREPPGEDLAALRAGLGRSAGTVPKLWPFYTSWTDGEVTPELEAEHAALALYGLHQQGRSIPMHKRGVSPGAALRALHGSNQFSEAAVDRRVATAVSSTSVPAFVYRLRGLITQLRGVGQPLDYDLLLRDIKDWHSTEARRRVRRNWGLAYHAWGSRTEQDKTPTKSS